jgi:hypothetical protein
MGHISHMASPVDLYDQYDLFDFIDPRVTRLHSLLFKYIGLFSVK